MRKIARLGPNPALAEILAETGELDRILSGRGMSSTGSKASRRQRRRRFGFRSRIGRGSGSRANGEARGGLVVTATTVFGVAHRAGGLSRTTSVSGRFQDALLIRKIDRELPEAGIVVTVDHDSDAAVGEVVYCELDRYERLNVVSVLDGDWTEVEPPLFYSGEFKYRAEPTTNGRAWIADHACLMGCRSRRIRPASRRRRSASCPVTSARPPTVPAGRSASAGTPRCSTVPSAAITSGAAGR